MNIDEYEEHIRDLIQSNQLDQITRYIRRPQDNLHQSTWDRRLVSILLDGRYHSTVSLRVLWRIIHRLLPPYDQGIWIYRCILYAYGLEGILTSVEGGWIDLRDPTFIAEILNECRQTIDVQLAFIDRLIELGLNVNDCVSYGHTLLHYFLIYYLATPPRHMDPPYHGPPYLLRIVSHLLEKGADPLLEGKHGQSAIDCIRNGLRGRIDISSQLLAEMERWV